MILQETQLPGKNFLMVLSGVTLPKYRMFKRLPLRSIVISSKV